MEHEIRATADGSFTVVKKDQGITYHSLHGAASESMHVYINAGLQYFADQHPDAVIRILEMGFGTGFNAYLSAMWATEQLRKVVYETLEKYPLPAAIISAYADHLKPSILFQQMHDVSWNQWEVIDPYFTLYKHTGDIFTASFQQLYDIVFYDAFAPTAQPELWTEEVFRKIATAMNPNGILVTYCTKGIVKRALKAAGFKVQALPGPPRKREMLRAVYTGSS
jgi:tRNA U34 5-methylaminomethyl-2-thiouridine-forming methyltransferase MnmC